MADTYPLGLGDAPKQAH